MSEAPQSSASPFREPKRWIGFLISLGVIMGILALLKTGGAPDDVEVGHWSSVMPPVLAVLLAIRFQQLIFALIAAVVLGSFLAFWGDSLTMLASYSGPAEILAPASSVIRGFDAFIIENLTSSFNLFIFFFTFALVGMVHVMSRSGGVHGMIDVVVKFAKGARSTRVATALMGLVIFFDDYANSVVVGTTMRGLSDRRRISREKLAYLVDSTAAPVSGIAIISTWIAFEVGLFNEIALELGLERDGYEIFLSVLPLRFYCVTALMFVFISSILGRDFGPMLAAERRAATEGKVLADDAKPLSSGMFDSILPPEGKPRRWANAVVPILCVVLGVTAGMLFDGADAVAEAGVNFSLLSMDTWRIAFGDAESAKILFWASMFGSAVAIGMAAAQRIVTVRDAFENWLKGIPAMKLAVGILLLAWAIKSVCEALDTSGFLIAVMGDAVSLTILPIITFLLAAVIAFSTGTSWGTMGILLPVALPLAHALGDGSPESMLVMWLVASAVLDGAIFGDHCSPISDTTVLSSIAAGCDHLHHVRTQIPYAVASMSIAAGFGYLGVALGLPVSVAYPAILVCSIGLFIVVGRRVPDPPDEAAPSQNEAAAVAA